MLKATEKFVIRAKCDYAENLAAESKQAS